MAGTSSLPARLSALCLVAAIAGAGAQTATQPPPNGSPDTRQFTLLAHFEKGQTWRYRTQSAMTMTFKVSGGTAGSSMGSGMDMTMRYKVQETKPDGTAIFAARSEGGKMMNVSNDLEALPEEADNSGRTVTLDRLARITALKDTVSKGSVPLGFFGQQLDLLVQLHFLPLPDKPVKMGDSWTSRYLLPGAKPKDAPGTEVSTKVGNGDEETDDPTAIRAKMTLMGTEKVGTLDTLKIKEVVTMPFELYADAQGKPQSDAKNAASHISTRLIFTQMVNALPTDGEILASKGQISGWVKFEGAVAKQVPGDTMNISGTLAAARLEENAPPAANQTTAPTDKK